MVSHCAVDTAESAVGTVRTFWCFAVGTVGLVRMVPTLPLDNKLLVFLLLDFLTFIDFLSFKIRYRYKTNFVRFSGAVFL